MKFVMFPLGVGIFTPIIHHDEFWVSDSEGKMIRPKAAGTVHLKQKEAAGEEIVFGGSSINLGMNATAVYPDWQIRHEQSGLPALQKEYPMYRAQVFFFPFAEISKFTARGVGGSTEPTPTSLSELIDYIKGKR